MPSADHALPLSPESAPSPSWLESDLAMLESHMDSCERSRGNFFGLRSTLEHLQALASPRIVTSASLCVACCLVAVFAFA